MKNLTKSDQKVSALKSGMDVKTARKYISLGKLPSECKKGRNWKTRGDIFLGVWGEIESYLEYSPQLQARTMLDYLKKKYPKRFKDRQLRTLQRRFQDWKVSHGEGKEVIFSQVHIPGKQSQSDYTHMEDLGVTINGRLFKHLLFHFVLIYSRWESVMICYEESFNSLVFGYEKAVWELGGITKEHRTDNLSAAVKRDGDFTERWKSVMDYYKTKPSRNNPGRSNENGSIEKSHDLYKKAVAQQLILRGSKDFPNLESYKKFLEDLVKNRNTSKRDRRLEELKVLKELPADKWYSPELRPVRVGPESMVHIDGVPYSVPSRLISYMLKAHIYPDKIELYYGSKKLQTMEKSNKKFAIDYRHIIDSLLRKPGAFNNYRYKEVFFPRIVFRKVYDLFQDRFESKKADKKYLELLQLSKLNGEQNIAEAIDLYLMENKLPLPEEIKKSLDVSINIPKIIISQPKLSIYDQLRKGAV